MRPRHALPNNPAPLVHRFPPLPFVFNRIRTLSFSVDKRIQPNSFRITRFRTLLQNMGGGGGTDCAGVKVILEVAKSFRMRSHAKSHATSFRMRSYKKQGE